MSDKAMEAARDAVADGFFADANGSSCDLAQAAITAYLAALEADGFVMVPVEPSEGMRAAGWDESPCAWPDGTQWGLSGVYRAMIAARPQVKG